MQNLSKIDTAKDLVTKEWVEAQDFLPSEAFTKNGIKNALGIADWALAASKPSYNFSEIGSKPDSFSGYGITNFEFGSAKLTSSGKKFIQSFGGEDTYLKGSSHIYLETPYVGLYVPGVGTYGVVHAGNYKTELTDIVLQSGGVNITNRDQYKNLGYGYTEGGWKTAGPVFSFGIPAFQHYINCEVFSNKIYHCAWNNGTQEEWALLLDDKNIGTTSLPSLNLNGDTITSWSNIKSKITYSFSEIGSKPTTLDGYGITDAVYRKANFNATSSKPYILGYSNASYGWKVTGPAMLFGTSNYYARLNFAQSASDSPSLYLSLVNAGTEYGWAQVVTDKNFTEFGVKAGRRYTGAYDDDPKSANDINYPSMAGFAGHLADVPFPNGNLLAITTNPNLYVGQLAISSDGKIVFRSRNETTWTDWKTMLHTGNIGDYAMSKAGGTIDGNLTINGEFKTQTTLGHVSLYSNIFEVNASLKVLSGWALYLNGKGIQQWSDLGTYITPISSETTSAKTISPNTFYKWGSVSALSITLGAATNNTHINNYMFEFTASTGFSLGGLSGVKWADGVKPNIKAGYTYQFSIINNCATYSAFKTA